MTAVAAGIGLLLGVVYRQHGLPFIHMRVPTRMLQLIGATYPSLIALS